MKRAAGCFFALFFLALVFSAVFARHCRANEAAASTATESPYQQAIKNAEEELAQNADASARSPAGWNLSDFLGLAALAAALALVVWATRWSRGSLFRPVAGREMRMLDRMAISKNTTLILVRLRGRDYWLADHAQGVTLLHEDEASGDEPPPSPSAKRPSQEKEEK